MNWFLKEYPLNTKVIFSTLTNYFDLIETIKIKGIEDDCFVKIDGINFETAQKMLNNTMNQINRVISNANQKSAIDELFKRVNESGELYALYVKLIFDITKSWYSFTSVPVEFSNLLGINETIQYIFESIEDDYGQLLVSKCLFYFTLNNESGISDCEMEDVLSNDDVLIGYLFEKQKSPNGRFPITLWNRIKFHLKEYITFKLSDETPVHSWFV